MIRRLAALAAAMLVALGSIPALALPPGGTFSDDNGNPHEGFIEAIAAIEVTRGCSTDGTLYCPDDPVTRAQMASFLARAFELDPSAIDWFSDDDGSTHEPNINKVAEAGITLGIDDDAYGPSELVTRAQMASFLARALDLPASVTDWFHDDDGSSHEANINAVAEAGITLGCDKEGHYCPDALVERDQMASFIGRALGLDPVEVPPGWPTDGTPLTDDEARALFSIYFQPEDVEVALVVAQCESNLDPTAVNPSGLHGGLFQHAISAWDDRATNAGWEEASIFDPEANTAVSAWLVEVDGWWHWSCWHRFFG